MRNIFKFKSLLNVDPLLNLSVFCFIILFFFIIIAINIIFPDKEKDFLLWQPWLSITNNQISSVSIFPVMRFDCQTISNVIQLTDKTMIKDVKNNMDRNVMEKNDRPGYHWFSKRKIRLTAKTKSGDFSFLLSLHDDFPSIEYQMLIPTLEKSRAFRPQQCPGFYARGQSWRSTELYRIILEIIEKNKIQWVRIK